MKKYMMLLILLSILFLSSCDTQFLNNEYEGGDWFYLENAGAVMPVWVRGNTSSDVFVIFLHGGPGGSSLDLAISSAYKNLHKEYAFVYFDQRGSGASQGNAKPESLTVDQFVEDLQKLVHLIRYKYNNPALFLMGHSWGGSLGTAYLLETRSQQYISGWIEINGGHNLVDGIKHSWEWVKTRADEKINDDIDVSYWQNEINWYNNTAPIFGMPSPLERHVKNLQKLNGYFHNSSNEPDIVLFSSPLVPFGLLIGSSIVVRELNLETFNLSPEMNKITTPSLI